MSHGFKNNDFADILFNRRSIRSYDPTVKISREEMLQMLAEATKAPSSVNMQPWRFVIVESDEAKNKLKPLVRTNQLQTETSSAMILIFGDMACYEFGETIYDQALTEGKMPQEVHDHQVATIIPYYQKMSSEQMYTIVQRDSMLAAMQLLLVARGHGYDTNVIGGFENDQLAAAFDLDPTRYVPATIVSIGKAAEAGYDSVRLDPEQVTWFK